MRLSLPPKYTLCPSALLRRSDIPLALRMNYLVLYALAWRNDYKYVDASFKELAEVLNWTEEAPMTAAMVRLRMTALAAHGLIERRRQGRRYLTYLLLRHDTPAPQYEALTAAEELRRNLIRGRPGPDSTVDRFAYEILDDAEVDYEPQYHPEGCPFWFDIYLPHQNLLIELDSPYWHHGKRAKQNGAEDKDRRKDAWARDHGLELIRIPVKDLRDNRQQTDLTEQLLSIAGAAISDPQSSLTNSPMKRTINSNRLPVAVDETKSEQQQYYSDPADIDRIDRNRELLESMGLVGAVVNRLAAEEHVTPDYLERVMAYRAQQGSRGKILGTGWVVKCVGEGWNLPEVEAEPGRYRYIQGKYKEWVRH